MRGGDANATLWHAGIDRDGQSRLPAVLAQPYGRARSEIEPGEGRRVGAGDRRRRVARLLQRWSAPDQRIRGVDRYVGDPLEPVAPNRRSGRFDGRFRRVGEPRADIVAARQLGPYRVDALVAEIGEA